MPCLNQPVASNRDQRRHARLNRKEARPLHHLIASCLNDACRDTVLIDVSNYPDDIEVPSFQRRAKSVKFGGKR